jgi:hypothetical protein
VQISLGHTGPRATLLPMSMLRKVAKAMTQPQRPEIPHVEAYRYEPDGYVIAILGSEERDGFKLTGKLFTKDEAERVVALVNSAPAVEAELSALREARRDYEALFAAVQDAAGASSVSSKPLECHVAELRTERDALSALVREAIGWVSSHPGPYETRVKWLEKARSVLDGGKEEG